MTPYNSLRALLSVFIACLLITAALADYESDSVNFVGASEYAYFSYRHNDTTPFWIYLDPCTGNPDLLVSETNPEPTLQSYTYLSLNSRGTEFISIASGPGKYYMGAYGMTESRFRLQIEKREREKVTVPDHGHIHVHSISSSRVEIIWNAIRITDDFRNLGTTMESNDDGSQKIDPNYTYWVYYLIQDENVTRLTKQERIVDTTCGMEYLSKSAGQGELINFEGEQKYFKQISGLQPNAVYSVNVMAVKNTGERAAYSSVLVRTVNSKSIKLNYPQEDTVELGQYKYYQLQIKNPERFNLAKDNYYQRKDVKLWLNLYSTEGDADIYVSTTSAPSFDDAEFSSEGLQVDRLAVDVFDNTVTYFISIYGKTRATYQLNTELSIGGELQENNFFKNDDEEKNSDIWDVLKIIFGILEIILS